MANINKIKLNNVSYDIEDRTARESASSAVSTANSAKSTADTANTTANSAVAKAEAAQNTANSKMTASYESATTSLVFS